MQLSKVGQSLSATLEGVDGRLVQVQAAFCEGAPSIQITGLAGDMVKESRERVKVSINSLVIELLPQKILVHLSPASAKKQGSHFDLSIALAILAANGTVKHPDSLMRIGAIGELGLDGRVLGVNGCVGLLEALEKSETVDLILLPKDNAWEAGLINCQKVRLVEHLAEALDFLNGRRDLPMPKAVPLPGPSPKGSSYRLAAGQQVAQRALTVALAGRHHLLLLGPPGVGKSWLAASAPSWLPPLTTNELTQVVKVYAASTENWVPSLTRPFRAPHHSISASALVGGGTGIVRPGEVTLAHAGILFLDEFPEFRRDAIESLREPLQNGRVNVTRVGCRMSLPAQFTLVSAMNPCPCGHALSEARRCLCPWEKVQSYRKRISKAILDRLDLGVVMSVEGKTEWAQPVDAEKVSRAIGQAHGSQRERNENEGLNGDENVSLDNPSFALGVKEQKLLEDRALRGSLSLRARGKLIRVARTIADLEGAPAICASHLEEAWTLRCPDLNVLGR